MSSSTDDGALYCQIRRNTKTIINGVTFDLEKDTYYLLVAAGSSVSGKSLKISKTLIIKIYSVR